MGPRPILAGGILLAGSFLAESLLAASKHPAASNKRTQACRSDPAITLPPGFCATIFADNLVPASGEFFLVART